MNEEERKKRIVALRRALEQEDCFGAQEELIREGIITKEESVDIKETQRVPVGGPWFKACTA